MGKRYDTIDTRLRRFIEQQRMFFVATAPLSGDGHVNLSPKGLDSFRVTSPTQVAYLDQVGSGAETIAHLRENGRIVVMFCAFEGPPNIVRLHGRGRVVESRAAEWTAERARFGPGEDGRAIIIVDVERITDSCGYGVPEYAFTAERPQLDAWAARKGETGLERYQREHNATSIDGLPALGWVAEDAATE
tara:strand:- start:221 stop:790 length:570 start_codon:yes stop_codon:yes gene_type:complete